MSKSYDLGRSLQTPAAIVPVELFAALSEIGSSGPLPSDSSLIGRLQSHLGGIEAVADTDWGAILEARAIAKGIDKDREEALIERRVSQKLINKELSERTSDTIKAALFFVCKHLEPTSCLSLCNVEQTEDIFVAQALACLGSGKLEIACTEDEQKYIQRKFWMYRDRVNVTVSSDVEAASTLRAAGRDIDLLLMTLDVSTTQEEIEKAFQQLSLGGVLVVLKGNRREDDHKLPESTVSVLDLDEVLILQKANDATDAPVIKLRITSGIEPEQMIWIFGSPRSGTTWLRNILRDTLDAEVWEEPFVGDLFGGYYYWTAQEGQLKAKNFIMGNPVRRSWITGIREFVLKVSEGRFPALRHNRIVVIKEPSGSIGAPLLREAFPESRLVVVVRNPLDVASSYLDASKKGSWLFERRSRGWIRETDMANLDPDEFVQRIATEYNDHVSHAEEAFEKHAEGKKTLLRYEDLLRTPEETTRNLLEVLKLGEFTSNIEASLERNAWKNIPSDEKGAGKFYRRGKADGWRLDLTPRQVSIVSKTAQELLARHYAGDFPDLIDQS